MKSEPNQVTRRQFIQVAGSSAAVLLGGSRIGGVKAAASEPQAFRFVHLTDIHVKPELRAEEGFRQCMKAVHELKPRPDFILTGGDLVMDVLEVPESRAKKLFDMYTSVCKDSDIPFHNCIGNHDVFGWAKNGGVAPDHISYGKKMAMERLGLEKTTYSFEHKGWHFCAVDDIQPSEEAAYEGGISEEDLHWLDGDLKAAGEKPKVMVLHVPVINAAVYRGVNAKDNQPIQIGRGMVCCNAGPILEVIKKHGVKLVLSGHLHENETITYAQTKFIGEGAVSGSWWKGPHVGNPEGFGVIDVRLDGTFEHQYQTYGWKAEPRA
jgi:3',5'-cyclic-AMP phosphodiesterase